MQTNLSKYNNSWYQPGAGFVKRALWFCVSACFFLSYFPFSGFKIALLRLFGAKIGKGVIIKPAVNIKYPWKLHIGNHSWIGERAWIDNLELVSIGDHCCISQGAYILCGNHNYKKHTFDLLTRAVTLETGVWIGAKAVVCPGVVCHSHAVLTAGSVATGELGSFAVYQGNPAVKIKERVVE